MAEVPAAETENIGPIRRARTSLAALETLERLRQAPNTPPSPDDLAALRGWSGWGPLAPALEYARSGTWQQIGERIGFLLPPEHYTEGMQATYNAFYTPPQLASACWQILTGLGFNGGNVLEPGCGAGAFMAHAPDDIQVRWTGIERDPTTAAITAALHPTATIQAKRLEEASLPSASMDAVIGNVPFGDVAVYDPTAPWQVSRSLHNYFIYRSIQALKPGGIATLITSRYTLDAYGDDAKAVRAALAWDADLLGAIRLPNAALAEGGTEALSDILVLRKRRPDDPRDEDQATKWYLTGSTVARQQINEYFLANPQMVLGELGEDRVPRYGRTLRVDARPDDAPWETSLAAAGRAIVERAESASRTWRIDSGAVPITAETAPFELRADGKKEGSFHLVDGVVHEVVESKLTPVARSGKELPKLIALRDATLTLLDAEADHARPDADLEPLRAEANRHYDAYVKAHGYLNRFTVVEGKPDEDGVVAVSRRRPSMGGFRRDPDFVTVLALEDFDDDTRTATKAALLERRVNRPRQRATSAQSPAEAVALCRDELGRIEVERIAELLGVDAAEAEGQLAEVAFFDPAAEAWAPVDEYLTGNVRVKLDRARQAAGQDPERYGRNLSALEAVQPADLEPEQIYAGLGASWIPASDVRAFAEELLGFDVRIWHEPRTSMWSVTTSARAEESAIATSEWGTARWNAFKLVEAGLNGKAPVVYDLIDDVRVRNQDETIAANDRLDAIAARFSTWVWEDPDRADRLAASYNQTFNAVVPRKFDGSHLTFPGLDTDFTPYEHQADMVARMISGDDALCPYPVGTGKTATMFMAAAKLKALGLAQKPLIIVVPSTLEQIARDGKRLFPNAKILMAGKEDLRDARARKLFAARCAMEDWDAVVMSHPSFTSLPVHATVQAKYVANLADEYRTALISAKSSDASSRKIKQIAKMVDRLEAEAKNLLRHATDDGVFFEHLGVDYLLVDEMQYFKNLNIPVHTDGFAVQGSKRSQDLNMKINWLRNQHPGFAVVTGFSGTPVSNTLLEAYILQYYLQPQRLEEQGILSADAWAADFVRFATAVEITPDGSFRLNRRPAEIVNIPELMHTLGEVAELRPPEAFPVKRPEVRRHNVAVEASDTVTDYVALLGERADAIHAGGVPPDEDNMLKICSDGRKIALHESLVGLPPDGPGKIGTLVGNVARIYHQTKDLELPDGHDPGVRGRLQLAFCDLGTPNKDKGNQVYGLIRRQLIEAGVPAERIRFIHDAATAAQRLALFDQCNKGEINVLLGSTDKLGVGVNVQRRAIALHHVDAPWRPDQVEQRDGRVWRPKNLNTEVEIYRYVTEGSFDAFMWQALERKEKALRPILSGQATARSIEDIGDVALDYGQIKAITTGNPMLAELNEINVEVKRLASLNASFQRNQRRLRNEIQTFTMQAAHAANQATALEAVARTAEKTPADSRWTDTRRNPVARDDEASVLAKLAESTIAKGYCDGTMQWRGLEVSFAYSKNSGSGELTARITTPDDHRITVPLKTGWTATGQHWRIRDAITAAVNDAHLTAAATREQITTLNQRIAENEAALELPFPEADALEAARTRRAALDTAIREQADKDEQARRNRPPRALTRLSQRPDSDEERHQQLVRLHTAMSTLAERVRALQQPQAPVSAPKLEIPRLAPVPEPVSPTPESSSPNPAPNPVSAPETPDAAEPNDVIEAGNVPAPSTVGRSAPDEPPEVVEPDPADDEAVLDATASMAAPKLEEIEPAPLLPTSDPDVPPTQGAEETESEFGTPRDQVQEPDYEQLYAEEFAQDVPVQAQAQAAPGSPTGPAEPGPADAVNSADQTAGDGLTEEPETEAASEDASGQAPTTGNPSTSTNEASTAHQSTAPAANSEEHTADQAERTNRSGHAQLGSDDATQSQTPAVSTEPTPQSSPPSKGRPAAPPSTHQRSQMLDHALDLALQGLAVFPLRPGTKIPLIKDWKLNASTDVDQIMRWWTATPHANIAIACGPSNLLVIDLDADKTPGSTRHGQRSLINLAAGRGIPRTLCVASARGGRHLYYRQPDGARFGNTVGSLGELIDTRGYGGYIVAPGSVFDGGTYRVEREAAIAELPTWIAEELEQRRTLAEPHTTEQQASAAPVPERRRTAYGQAALRRAATAIESAHEGTRNHTLNREAFRLGQLVGGGILDLDQATNTLRRAARKAGLEPAETDKTITSGLTAGIQRPRAIPERTPDPKVRPGTTPKETTMTATTTDTPTHDETPNLDATTPAPSHNETPEPAEPRGDQPRTDHNPTQNGPTEETPQAPDDTDTGQAPDQEEPADAPDLDAIFAETQERINAARQALPDHLEFADFDELQDSIDQLRHHLAQAPIRLRPASQTPANPVSSNASQAREPEPEQDSVQPPPAPAADLDEHLAAVDTAYTEAQAAGIPADRSEWVAVNTIHSAIHNLVDTLKAAAGTYWTELAADARVHGLLTTIATRAARAIAYLANAAANRLEQDPGQQPRIDADGPGLRETYVNARSQIRGHAATHEWQRITALWGTINTLARQTDDPGIRAVVARSADAIADYAEALARKITQYGNPGNTPESLNALARAAEGHATGLRGMSGGTTANTEPSPASAAVQPVSSSSAVPPVNRQPDARALQQAAQQVARHTQQRLGLPARPQGGNALRTPVRNRPNAHHARPQQHAADQQAIVPGSPGPR